MSFISGLDMQSNAKIDYRFFLSVLACLILSSCSQKNSSREASASLPIGPNSYVGQPSGKKFKNALDEFPKNQESIEVICSRPGNDKFRAAFCQRNPPTIKGIRDLYVSLGISLNANNFACTTNSVSLVRNEVGVLNPRCIGFTRPNEDSSLAAVAYQRSQLNMVEIVTRDPETAELSFYLMSYDLECEKSKEGCQIGDYFTESAESNWTNLSFYEDVSLQNTAFDCKSCHQPGGPGTKKNLRMAEASLPWSHWLSSDTDCGKALISDFTAAHGRENFYAGIPILSFSSVKALNLELFVNNNGFTGRSHGNDFFNSFLIEKEITERPDLPSPTWTEEYKRRNKSLALDVFGGVAMPYPHCRQSNEVRLSSYTKRFSEAVSNKTKLADVPVLSEVNRDSEEDLRARGLMADKELTDSELLKRACLACHNSRLDQSLDKSRFNVERLDLNSTETIDKAINRLAMENDDLEKMPPKLYLNLNESEKRRLMDYLRALKRQKD